MPRIGLEPTCLTALDPKSSVSTNSTTWAKMDKYMLFALNSFRQLAKLHFMRKTAIALVFSPDQHSILLVKRRDIPVWVFPGGGIDLQEEPEKAAVREVLEETGITVKTTHKIAEYTPTNFLTSEMHIYKCAQIEGKPRKTEETRDAAFFPLDKLPKPFFFTS